VQVGRKMCGLWGSQEIPGRKASIDFGDLAIF